MKLYEYQAKELFAKFGIPTPGGQVADSAEAAAKIAVELGLPVAVKAQVQAGGRGKAGGIKIAKTSIEVKEFSRQILGMKIKELPVKKVLLEPALEIEQEFYLGIIVDRASKGNTLIFSSVGGIDIEDVAKNQPEKIIKTTLTRLPLTVPPLPGGEGKEVMAIAEKLYDLYLKNDATLAEINPLVRTKSGQFIAADGKIIIDDNALFRQPEFSSLAEESETDSIEAEARRRKIAYVRLPGNVGVLGNGAGLVMSTMDEVKRAGGSPASFLDIGGGARAGSVRSAFELLLMDKNIQGIFFNVFGGITRCDEVAQGIIETVTALRIELPVVVRLTGTKGEEGRRLLEQAKLPFVGSMQEGAKKIVEYISR